ncbi:BatD family protein [Chryseobacterium taklimakanense]|uniref:BatD family protein n=1 Tax=Chryseobacterium taklimakanense TaxID=536441 RepID=UPI0023F91CDD|nr:BatD family protein [Chryseobacterium taklimakanense]
MREKLQYLLLLISSVITYGQVNVVADTDKKELNGKESFVFTIIQETVGNENIQETPLRMPDLSKFNKIAEGSVRNTYVDERTKTVINQLVYEYVLEPKQPGKFLIGSALVTVSGRIYKSEPFYVTVKDGDFGRKSVAENTSENVYLNMELQNKEVYQNQPAIAVLRAYSKDFNNLRRVGKVSFPDNRTVVIKPVSFAKSDIEQRSEFSSQVIAVVMIFPNESGRVNVPPASVAYIDNGKRMENLKSNPVKLHVKRLPSGSPENFKNAVGKYKVSIAKSSPAETEINKPVDVVVKIKGHGNLDAAHLPKILNSKDYSVYKPEILSHVKGGRKGIEGEVTAKYVIIPKKAGNISVNTESFSFFNPEQRKYINLGIQTLNLNVMTPQQIAGAKTTIERVNDLTNEVLETVNTPIIETEQYKIHNKSKLNWKTLFANYSLIALFLGLIVFFISGLKKMNSLKPKTEKISLGSIAETEAALRSEIAVDVDAAVSFFEKLIEEERYGEFFNAFFSFDNDVKSQVFRKYKTSLKEHFENHKGQQVSEDYRNLIHTFEIEKYAPVHTKEHLLQLLAQIKSLYSQIV